MLIQFIMSGPVGFLTMVAVGGVVGCIMMEIGFFVFDKIIGYFVD